MKQLLLVAIFLVTVILLNAGFSPKIFFVSLFCLAALLFLNVAFNISKLKNIFSVNRGEYKETLGVSVKVLALILLILIVFIINFLN